ncbi:MAG: WD40 repeat domain-containing protein [Chthoniobacterales bacterium]|nr:WD40 repeat domain-containing protein [Chthoniobacterales bacterium]
MRHAGTVRNARFSRDGNKIVTPSLDETARIWDRHTAGPLGPPLRHADYVWDVAMSPDGKTFATSSYDNVFLWSLVDGSRVGVPMKHQSPVLTPVFSPDGSRLLTASQDVRLWNLATGQLSEPPMRHDDFVYSAAFNRDATKILSAGSDNMAYIWDAATPKPPGEIIPIPGAVASLEFAGVSNDTLFVAMRDGQAGLWSLGKKRFVAPVAQQGAAISVATYDSAAARFATAGPDGTVHFWNATTGQELGHAKAKTDSVVVLAFAPDGRSLFAAYLGGSVVHWSFPEGALLRQAWEHPEKIDSLAVSPSGGEIAVGCRDDYVYFWDTRTGRALPPTIKLKNGVIAVAYSPDGKSLATGGNEHVAQTWSLPLGKTLGDSFVFKGNTATVRFTARGNALLVNGSEKTEVTCYDVKTHDSLYLPLSHPQPVTHVAANTSGSVVVTVTNDGVARLWRIPHTTQPPPASLPDYLRAIGGLAFSTDQRLLEVPTRERLALRQKLIAMPRDSSQWGSIMRSSFQQLPAK